MYNVILASTDLGVHVDGTNLGPNVIVKYIENKNINEIIDIEKDKIIKDLIRKRFDSDYEKNIIKEYSVNNPKYPNMHKDFYEMIKTIYYMFTNENNVLASTYKIKLEMLANKYRDYRGIPDSEIDYINLSRINKISR